MDDAVLADSKAQQREIWAVREGTEWLEVFQPQYRYDVGVPIHRMHDYVKAVWNALDRSNPGGRRFTFGHVGDNNLHFVVAPGSPDFDHEACDRIVYEPLRPFRGAVSAEHGIGLAKRHALPYSRSAVELDVMRSVKRALDPRGILNPGKVYDVEADREADT
jgi:FAD/FMN-containing dehydrogenase